MDERGNEAWDRWWRGGPLIAFVEQRDLRLRTDERPNSGTSWVLDVVREWDVANLLGGGAGAAREVPFLATAQIGLDLDGEAPDDLVPFEEGTWHRVELASTGQHPATLYRDLDAVQTEPARLAVLAAPSPDMRAALTDLVGLKDVPEATATELDLLDQPADFVSVYHVGQGNLNALCDKRGVPLLYFDFGGGCLRNAGTYPVGLPFCGNAKPVLLSHWDFDHWFSATKFTFPPGTLWIAPDQTIGPRTKKFVHHLAVKQGVNLVRWPAATASHKAGVVSVTRCTGQSKNDSGLALWCDAYTGIVLSPGDATFDYVPIPPAVRSPLAGLVASHHGAAHLGAPVPKPTKGGVLAFSFGSGNSFKHPTGSRHLYSSEGWKAQYDTPLGHVALGGPKRDLLGSCGPLCMVATRQP
jgi:hypothetical protein